MKHKIPQRERLLKFARENPLSIKQLAEDIDIAPATLKSFLLGAGIEFKTQCKIENYLLKHEVRNGSET